MAGDHQHDAGDIANRPEVARAPVRDVDRGDRHRNGREAETRRTDHDVALEGEASGTFAESCHLAQQPGRVDTLAALRVDERASRRPGDPEVGEPVREIACPGIRRIEYFCGLVKSARLGLKSS